MLNVDCVACAVASRSEGCYNSSGIRLDVQWWLLQILHKSIPPDSPEQGQADGQHQEYEPRYERDLGQGRGDKMGAAPAILRHVFFV